MDDLVAWAKSQVQERWEWNARQEVALSQSVTHIMNVVRRVSCSVKCSLWPDDVDIFTVVDSLTNERHILKTENRQLLLTDIRTESSHSDHVKTALSKDRSNQGALLDMRLDLSQDLTLGVARRANDNNVSFRHNFFGVVRAHIDLALQVSLGLPGRLGSVASDFLVPDFRSSGHHVDGIVGVVVPDTGNGGVGQIASSANRHIERGFHTIVK